MNNFVFFILMVFVGSIVHGQQNTEELPTNLISTSKWKSDGFTYADFGTGEEHSYLSVIYEMNPKLYLELQSYYDTYRSGDILDVSIRARWYPVKKLYLFTGVGTQLQRTKVGQGIPVMPFRIVNGVGYEATKNISIEAIHDLNFNSNSAGLNATPSLFSVKGKYSF